VRAARVGVGMGIVRQNVIGPQDVIDPPPESDGALSRGTGVLHARLSRRVTSVPSLMLGVDISVLALVNVLFELTGSAIAQNIPVRALASFSLLVLLLFWEFGVYAVGPRVHILEEIRKVVAATGIAVAAIVVLPVPSAYALTRHQAFRIWWVSTLLLVIFRVVCTHWSLSRVRSLTTPTLIVGAGRVGRILEKRISAQPALGLNLIGFLDDHPLIEGTGSSLPVLGGCADLDRIVAEYGVKHVIVTFSTASNQALLNAIRRCGALAVSVSVVPRLFEIITSDTSVVHLGGLPLVLIRPSKASGLWFPVKYAVDRLLAFVLLVASAPVFAALAAIVWVSLGRPIFFRQLRVGRDGRVFEMLKFRTMRGLEPTNRAEGIPLPTDLATADSERCTPASGFLRRMSLDEFPQLINVLKGEMSLIGPRPERPELVSDFSDRIYRYNDRHRVKSGITGWTQIHGIGRGEHRFSDDALSDRVEWDNFYIENWSPWIDLKILLLTPVAVWRFRQRPSSSTHPTGLAHSASVTRQYASNFETDPHTSNVS
jgi:exopolysaccharide biosynthesis polyprenyl glycosylphosphotransferase